MVHGVRAWCFYVGNLTWLVTAHPTGHWSDGASGSDAFIWACWLACDCPLSMGDMVRNPALGGSGFPTDLWAPLQWILHIINSWLHNFVLSVNFTFQSQRCSLWFPGIKCRWNHHYWHLKGYRNKRATRMKTLLSSRCLSCSSRRAALSSELSKEQHVLCPMELDECPLVEGKFYKNLKYLA